MKKRQKIAGSGVVFGPCHDAFRTCRNPDVAGATAGVAIGGGLGRCSPFVLVVPKRRNDPAERAEGRRRGGRDGQDMRIIGIDPGLRCLGWGIIEAGSGRLRHVANGQCRSDGADLAARLLSLFRQLTEIVEGHAPDAAAVETTFVNRDGAGTLKLGQARGVAMLVPAAAGIPVAEYAPNAVKKAVVGAGHAEKRQIDHMVRMQLPGCDPAGPDAADALALALCHAFHARHSDRLARAVAAGGTAR
jgi:crossover junction endodeoxyribonuclease RuvC